MKRKLFFLVYEQKYNFRQLETNTSVIDGDIGGKMTILKIWILSKLYANPSLLLDKTFPNYSISTKNIVMLLTIILPSLIYQIVGKLRLNLISSNSSFGCYILQVSFPSIFLSINLSSFLQFNCLLLFTLGSSDKLYIRAEFSVYFCSEDNMLLTLNHAIFHFCQSFMRSFLPWHL